MTLIIDQFMVTKKSWHGYIETQTHAGFLEYIEATEDFLKVLDNMLATSNSLQEIKDNLNKLIIDRKDFVKFANQNLP